MRTMMRRGEHGKGNMGAILALIGFIIFVYAMFKIVPHFMNNYELDDFMKTEARFLSYGQRSEMEARTNIINKARGLDIPTDGLTISKDGRRVKIDAPVFKAVGEAQRMGTAAQRIIEQDVRALLAEPLEAARARLGIKPTTYYTKAHSVYRSRGIDPYNFLAKPVAA